VNERPVLGRGLDALIRPEEKSRDKGGSMVISLPEDSIRKNTYQPRHNFDEKTLEELARSIAEKGIIQPIIVQDRGDHYELIAGERRLLAARRAGLKNVPALVREVRDKKDLLEIAIIENIQREDLNPIDRALSYRRLIDEFGETQEQIAERVGKDRSSIANELRILDLPREIKDLIREGRLNFGQARALLALDSRELQLRYARRAADGGLSVRELEKISVREKSPPAGKTSRPAEDPDLVYALDVLREQLKAKVTITRDRTGGGKIEIEFYSPEELARLCRLLGVRDDSEPGEFSQS
jgi:ParB family transcriptional regulator, chromosome partitioning protein